MSDKKADAKADKKKPEKKEGGGDKKKEGGGDKKKAEKKEGGDKPKGDKKEKGDAKGDKKEKGDKKKEDKGGDKKAEKEKPPAAAADAETRAGDAPKDEKAAEAAPAGDAAPAEGDAKSPAAVVEEPLDPQSALKAVLRTSLNHDGLARGLHESVKALDRREAHLCVLSSGCNEPAYTKLITALCSEHSIPLIKVEESKVLGEWVGLCKFNSEGKAVKVVGCSCAVIRSWGEETNARTYILDHIKQQS